MSNYNLTFFLNYLRSKDKNPFEIVENDEMKKSFSPFIINRFLSFSNNLKIKNLSFLLNRYTFSFYRNPEILFCLMYKLYPKNVGFERLNYIKIASKTKRYNKEIYTIIKKYYNLFHLKTTEIDEFIDILLQRNKYKLLMILTKSGLTKQQILKYFPQLKEETKKLKETKLSKKEIKNILNKINKKQNNTDLNEFL